MDYRLTCKALPSGSLELSGYGIVWDSIDQTGEFFDRRTELHEQYWPPDGQPILWEHGASEWGKTILGRVTEAVKDDYGLRIKMRLDNLTDDFRERIVNLVEAGKLGISSGSVGSLSERVGSWISKWVPFEFSLSTNPCEPLTMSSLQLAKALPILSEHVESVRLAVDTEAALRLLEAPGARTKALGDVWLDLIELEETQLTEKRQRRLAAESERQRLANQVAALQKRLEKLN